MSGEQNLEWANRCVELTAERDELQRKLDQQEEEIRRLRGLLQESINQPRF